MEDDDPHVFLLALKDVADAQGGMSKLSRGSSLNRQSLYRTFSNTGNPKLLSIRSEYGLHLKKILTTSLSFFKSLLIFSIWRNSSLSLFGYLIALKIISLLFNKVSSSNNLYIFSCINCIFSFLSKEALFNIFSNVFISLAYNVR
ncbi:MAG: hypothetical protein H0W88_02465 [Parachlamydiaceae bacterium]|nr:hypothetical protein [Parachlamydiaceae bacterium]